jgi:hypothetical protein
MAGDDISDQLGHVPIDANKPSRHLRPRSRVIHDRAGPIASVQPRLELRSIFAEIVKGAGQPAGSVGVELGRKSRGEAGNFEKVLAQRLPVPPVTGVCEIWCHCRCRLTGRRACVSLRGKPTKIALNASGQSGHFRIGEAC